MNGEMQAEIGCAAERQTRQEHPQRDASQATGRNDRRAYTRCQDSQADSKQSALAHPRGYAVEASLVESKALSVAHDQLPGRAACQQELQGAAERQRQQQTDECEPQQDFALCRSRSGCQQDHVAGDRDGNADGLDQHDRAGRRHAVRVEKRLEAVHISARPPTDSTPPPPARITAQGALASTDAARPSDDQGIE